MNIWIVEDDPGYRRNLKMSLELESDIQIGHVFPSCPELFETLRKEDAPDVVLMDLGLPGMSSIEAIEKLSQAAPEVPVIVLTVFKEKNIVEQAMDAGAVGYLLKDSGQAEITEVLRSVCAGGPVLSLSLT